MDKDIDILSEALETIGLKHDRISGPVDGVINISSLHNKTNFVGIRDIQFIFDGKGKFQYLNVEE